MDCVQTLLTASQQGDLVTVKELLKQGLSVNSQGKDEITALQIAAANNQENVVQFLLSSGANVDLPNIYGWTPLMLAARYGHASVVSMLLKNKARVNALNKLGMRPLVAAVWSGHTSTVRLLLEAGAISDCPLMAGSALLECDLTSLMAAALNGHDSILKLLLDKEMSVNQASAATKLTPLMMAACNGHKQTAQILVERGADVNMVNICGKTALDIAKVKGRREVTAYLDDKTITVSIWRSCEEAEVIQAVKDANLHYLKQLLQEDATCCNQSQMDGVTPLMYAASLGHVDIVHLLVSSGADIDAQDLRNGWTALMYAVYHRQKTVVRYLVDAVANVNIRAKNDCTALDLACMLDNTDEDVRTLLVGKTDNLAEFYRQKTISTPSAIRRALHSFRKFSDNDRYSSKPDYHKDSPFKAWLGGVAHRLHNFKPTRPSKSLSSTPDVHCMSPSVEKSLSVSDSAFCESESEQINQIKQLHRCSLSSLRSPRQCQSEHLKMQSLEAVIPPLPPTPSSDVDREGLCMMSGHRTSFNFENKNSSNVCLQLTNLLKHHDANHIGRAGIPSPHSLTTTRKSNSDFTEDKSKERYSMHHSRTSRRWTENASNSSHLEDTMLSHFPSKSISPEASNAAEKTLTPSLKKAECLNEMLKGMPTEHLSSVKAGGDNLPSLLERLFLQRYIKKFEDQEVDLEAFQNLTDEDLMEIGVQSLKPRQQLLEIIRHLQQEELKTQTNYS